MSVTKWVFCSYTKIHKVCFGTKYVCLQSVWQCWCNMDLSCFLHKKILSQESSKKMPSEFFSRLLKIGKIASLFYFMKNYSSANLIIKYSVTVRLMKIMM